MRYVSLLSFVFGLACSNVAVSMETEAEHQHIMSIAKQMPDLGIGDERQSLTEGEKEKMKRNIDKLIELSGAIIVELDEMQEGYRYPCQGAKIGAFVGSVLTFVLTNQSEMGKCALFTVTGALIGGITGGLVGTAVAFFKDLRREKQKTH